MERYIERTSFMENYPGIYGSYPDIYGNYPDIYGIYV